jgi:hypothetical protein
VFTTIPLKLEKRKRAEKRKKKKKKEKDSAMYLVSLCREHLVAWPAVALFRQVAQDQELLPRKQGLLFAAKTRKGEKKAPSRVELCEVSSFALSGACLGK